MTKIYIQELQANEISDNYIQWMNDQEINQYLESRFNTYTKKDLIDFVQKQFESDYNYLFGIYTQENIHIGNIKIGGIDPIHKRGSIGLVIGKKEFWGQGIATQALNLLLEFVFNELQLHKVTAGMYRNNTGSYKLFKNAGFLEVGYYKEHSFYNDQFVDTYILELLKKDYLENK